jgi:hypothetical protein
MLCATDADLRVRRFGCFDGAQLLAAQAVVYHARWGMLLAAPFEFFYASPMLAAAPHCARARRAPKQCDALAALAREIARHFASVEFETHPALKDVRAFLETGWRVRPVYTHIWRVDQIEQTWAAMNREKRRAIKHALAQFAFAHAEDDVTLDAFLAVYRETMAKFSWRPSPKWAAMFRARLRWLTERGCARLYRARCERKIDRRCGRVAQPAGSDRVFISPRHCAGIFGRECRPGIVLARRARGRRRNAICEFWRLAATIPRSL